MLNLFYTCKYNGLQQSHGKYVSTLPLWTSIAARSCVEWLGPLTPQGRSELQGGPHQSHTCATGRRRWKISGRATWSGKTLHWPAIYKQVGLEFLRRDAHGEIN